MSIKVKEGGVLRTITGMKIKAGGIVRTIKTVKVMVGGVLETVATFVPAITLNISPDLASGVSSSPSGGTIHSNYVTATPSGGAGPYTYAWTRIFGTELVLSGPASATTRFSLNVIASDSVSATYRCTVTDAFGQTAQDTVSVTLTNTSGA